MEPQGRTALITGGTSGIGRGVAERFASEGAEVIISGRRRDPASRRWPRSRVSAERKRNADRKPGINVTLDTAADSSMRCAQTHQNEVSNL